MTPEETLAELLKDDSQHLIADTNPILQAIWPLLHAPQRRHSMAELVALFQRAGYVSDGLPSRAAPSLPDRHRLAHRHDEPDPAAEREYMSAS